MRRVAGKDVPYDDSEETMQERLAEDLKAFEEEFRNKDWTLLDEEGWSNLRMLRSRR